MTIDKFGRHVHRHALHTLFTSPYYKVAPAKDDDNDTLILSFFGDGSLNVNSNFIISNTGFTSFYDNKFFNGVIKAYRKIPTRDIIMLIDGVAAFHPIGSKISSSSRIHFVFVGDKKDIINGKYKPFHVEILLKRSRNG